MAVRSGVAWLAAGCLAALASASTPALAQQGAQHSARFSGHFAFEERCFYHGEACECPRGNRNPLCLKSLRVAVRPDPSDLGGRAYVLVVAGSHVLGADGRLHPLAETTAYTAEIGRLEASNVIDVVLPSRRAIAEACASSTGGRIEVYAGYGALSRDSVRQVEQTHGGKAREIILARAMADGYGANKYDSIGHVECPASGVMRNGDVRPAATTRQR